MIKSTMTGTKKQTIQYSGYMYVFLATDGQKVYRYFIANCPFDVTDWT